MENLTDGKATLLMDRNVKWILIGMVIAVAALKLIASISEIVNVAANDSKMAGTTTFDGWPAKQKNITKPLLAITMPVLLIFGAFIAVLATDVPARMYRDLAFSHQHRETSKLVASSILIMIICCLASSIFSWSGIYMGLGSAEPVEFFLGCILNVTTGILLGVAAAVSSVNTPRKICTFVFLLAIISIFTQVFEWSVSIPWINFNSKPLPDNNSGILIKTVLAQQAAQEVETYVRPAGQLHQGMVFLSSPFSKLLLIDESLVSNDKFRDDSALLSALTMHEIGHKKHNDIFWQKFFGFLPSISLIIFSALSIARPTIFLTPWNIPHNGSLPALAALLAGMSFTGTLSVILHPFYLWWLQSREYYADEFAISNGCSKGLIAYLVNQPKSSIGRDSTWIFERLLMTHPTIMNRLRKIETSI